MPRRARAGTSGDDRPQGQGDAALDGLVVGGVVRIETHRQEAPRGDGVDVGADSNGFVYTFA